MVLKYVIVFLSTLSIYFVAMIMNELKYNNKIQVDQVIQYVNRHVINTYGLHHQEYFTQDLDINSLLVKQDPNYCQKSDLHKYYHPDVLMKDTYVIRERKGIIKEVLRDNYFDAIPKMPFKRGNKNCKKNRVQFFFLLETSIYKFPLELTLPFNYYDQVITRFKEGQSSLCLFWKNNHMKERHSLSHKDNLQNYYYAYRDKMKKQKLHQDCISNATFMPKSFRLFKTNECKAFFKYIKSKEYKEKELAEGPQFITKLGLEIHRGRGIVVLFPEEIINIQNDYQNGSLCGQNLELKVVQKYINNPYLYKGHKIEFRIYFVFASTLPMIAYAYDKALIRKCATPFDRFSLEKSSHVCNTAIMKQTLAKEGIDPEDEDEGDEYFIDWKLDQLQQLLLQQGKINDTNWLQNYLYPIVDRSIIHAVRSTEHTFSKDSKAAEFFAADFILTDDFKVYIMEINYNPQTLKSTPLRIAAHTKMVKDMIDIQNAYIRSKYLRLKLIIDKIVQRMVRQNAKKVESVIDNSIIEELNSAYHDKLDQGIQLDKTNLFRKIMDLNYQGPQGYMNLIQQKCLK